MQLIPGGSLISSFDVQSSTGTPVDFDAAPTVTFYHNGVADTTWTSYTLTNVVAGHYVLTTTIPSGYALADEISVYVNGTISSVAVGMTVFEAQLANTPDNATLAAGQTFSTTGAVGSVTAPVTLPTAVPAAYATAANQVTILAQTTAASIAGAVWNALLASYNVASSFGNWLQSLINAPTASANATAAAAAILINPSDKLKTDVNGNVTFNNAIPVPPTTTQIQAALAAGSALPANVTQILTIAPTLTGGNINAYAVNASSGGGSGNGSVTVTVKSTASGTPVIPGATCSLNNSAGQQVAAGQTNASGQIVLSADAGTYTLLTTLSGQYGPVSQAFTMAVGTLNTAEVSMPPVAIPTNTPANYCAMTGTTFANGVGTAGIPWAIQITALPSGFPAGNEESANMSGVSGVEGAIGTGTPPSVILPQGATYSIQIGSGAWLTGQIVPSTPNGLLPAAFG